MAEFTYRDETTTRRVYSLPSPTNWVEVEKVFASIRNDLSSETLYDDTVEVKAWDDEIRFSYGK